MTVLGLDYAGGRPGGKAIKDAGYQFVVRYLSPGGPGLPGKLLTPEEYNDLLANCVSVAFNWETWADRMLGGHDAGRTDASASLSVINKLGIPPDKPVYFSADWDVQPTQMQIVAEYLRGAAEVLGPSRVGVYGGYRTVKYCFDNKAAQWAWQTGAWSPSSPASVNPDRHIIDPRAHIYQRVNSTAVVNGVKCDVNEALKPNFGQHPYAEEDDMTPEQAAQLTRIENKLDAIPKRVWDELLPKQTGEPTAAKYILPAAEQAGTQAANTSKQVLDTMNATT